MTIFTFPAMVAVNPLATGSVVANGAGQVYALSDTTYTTPLSITDLSGNPIAILRSNALGLIQPFQTNGYSEVNFRASGLTIYCAATVSGLTIPVWSAGNGYAVNQQVVSPNQDIVICTGVHTSTSTYDASKWAVSTTLAGKVGKGELVLNVKDYGAKGDGSTDDTAAIQAAITAAVGSFGAGGVVKAPPGNYFLNSITAFTTAGASTFPGYALRVPSNVTIAADHGAIFTENIDNTGRRVMFYLEGSNITIDGITYNNIYNMTGGSQPTGIPIAAGDQFNAAYTGAMTNIRIRDCTFLRPWYPTKFSFGQSGGTATLSDVKISGCSTYAEPAATGSGGHNFRTDIPGNISDVSVTNCHVYNVTVSAAIGYYGVWNGAVTGNVLRGSTINGAGIQCENGSDNISITGNTTMDHFNHIWIDDSTNVTITGNTMRNNTVSSSFKGIRVTKQGYTLDPNKVTTGINIGPNTLTNCFIVSEAFGTPTGTPSFGSIKVTGATITLDGVTNAYGISLTSGLTNTVIGCSVVGALTSSIYISPTSNQFIVVMGNITTKAGTESSVGFTLANTNAFRPIVENNQWINGAPSVGQAVGAEIIGLRIFAGPGTPLSVVSAPVGSLFLRTDGGTSTSLYVKESGTSSTGWVAK